MLTVFSNHCGKFALANNRAVDKCLSAHCYYAAANRFGEFEFENKHVARNNFAFELNFIDFNEIG